MKLKRAITLHAEDNKDSSGLLEFHILFNPNEIQASKDLSKFLHSLKKKSEVQNYGIVEIHSLLVISSEIEMTIEHTVIQKFWEDI